MELSGGFGYGLRFLPQCNFKCMRSFRLLSDILAKLGSLKVPIFPADLGP